MGAKDTSVHCLLQTSDFCQVNKCDLLVHYRSELLRRWKNINGLRATYGALLKACVDTGNTDAAQKIVDVLKGR